MCNSSSESSDLFQGVEDELHTAQSELEEYKRLLDELPEIYEDKFRQRVRAVAQDIRYLLDERKALQQQVAQALRQAPGPSSLPPAPEVEERMASPKRWKHVRLPRFSPLSAVLPSVQAAGRWTLSLRLGGVLVLVVAGVGLLFVMSKRSIEPVKPVVPVALPSAPSSAGELRLQASRGESWVLVEDLKGDTLFDAILKSGRFIVLPIGAGLRLRSGRPDLLLVGVGQQPSKPLGGIDDLGWVKVLPTPR